jgi:hypothetical protein
MGTDVRGTLVLEDLGSEDELSSGTLSCGSKLARVPDTVRDSDVPLVKFE